MTDQNLNVGRDMSERNLRVVRRYFDCINARDWDGVAAVTVPELSTAIRDFLWSAHRDLRIEVDWMEAHGDKVTAWCYGQGTHTAPWVLPPSMGDLSGQTIAPTGRAWRAACAATYRVTDGSISEVWAVWDWLNLLDQLVEITLA